MNSTSDSTEHNDDHAKAWRPEPGDQITGKVVGISSRVGYNDKPYAILTIRCADGTEAAAHCFHTVLKRELASYKPTVGELIEITYKGMQQTADARPYHAYG